MKIRVLHIYGGRVDNVSGEPDQVRAQLNLLFPWLERYGHETLQQDLVKLGNTQALMVEVS